MILCSSTLASYSPQLKPIGSHLGVRDVACDLPLHQALPRPVLGLNAQPGARQGALSPQTLAVPTQEQREEAAKQLREFQNAQIQRLVLQRKLAQNASSTSRLSAIGTPAPQASPSVLNLGSSFLSTSSGVPSIVSPSNQNQSQVLKPPPGLPHPTEIPYNPAELQTHDEESKGFLTDNELFLSKLLDDDDDDCVKDTAPSSLQTGIRSMSPESSLDPAAAPFVGKVGVGDQAVTPLFAKSTSKDESKGDGWQSGNAGELSLKESGSSPSKVIRGVYGGSVW